jgi:hypothetical protein
MPIFVRLIGGLGNQMFIYAFGLAHSKRKRKKLIIDNISGFGSPGDKYKSVFALEGLCITEEFIDQSLYRYVFANRYFWFLSKVLRLSHFESKKKYTNIDNINSYFYIGYWQSYKYFDEYRDILKDRLLLRDCDNLIIRKNKNNILAAANPVAIGMRFYEETNDANLHHDVLNKDYYEKAIKLLEGKVENPVYFVFSTDIGRAKKMLCNYKNINYINPIKNRMGAKFDLYLMSLCKHYIISNGTFYWWASYLGGDNDSIVVAPKKGFSNKDILPNNWLKI